MKIDTVEQGGNLLMKITGDVDFDTSIQVREKVLELTKSPLKIMVVDLSGVEYMDSSGLATLVEGMQIVTRNNGEFIITQLNEKVRDVFELAHLNEVFTIMETLDEVEKTKQISFTG